MPTITAAQRATVNRDPIPSAHIILVEFEEDGSGVVQRAAINNEDMVSNGEIYIGTDINITLPNSVNGDTSVNIEMSNISRIVGRAIYFSRKQIGARIMLVDAADPDTTLMDTLNMLVLRNAQGDSVRISGQIAARASLFEPVPFRRTNRSLFPGVWMSK